MSREVALVFVLVFGTVFQLSCGTQVNVTKDDKLCLFANLTVHFSVSYDVVGNKTQTAAFELPETVTSEGSSCGDAASTLKLSFGDGHSFSIDFSKSGNGYHMDSITFSYNLSDSVLFINSSSEDTATVKVAPQFTNVTMGTCYSCHSVDTIQGDSVNMTMWNVVIQAFVNNGSKSEEITSCAADVPATTPTPPANTTTMAPATNTTTVAPATNTTSPPPTTPTPPLPTPKTGNYSVKPTNQSEACLLANFGLRIGYKQGGKYQEINFEPTGAQTSGLCGVNSSELLLESGPVTLALTFTNDTKKFRLHALNVTVKTSGGEVFFEWNSSLSLWEAALGSSYMCNKEQNVTISEDLTLLTFNVRVQPFGVEKEQFSTAEDCQADGESFLVPIAVGVALLVLILIVLLAYFIGRKRNMATGYESFS